MHLCQLFLIHLAIKKEEHFIFIKDRYTPGFETDACKIYMHMFLCLT